MGVTVAATYRHCVAMGEAHRAMSVTSAVIETQLAVFDAPDGKGTFTVTVFGAVITPVLGPVDVIAQSCGLSDNAVLAELTETDPWHC